MNSKVKLKCALLQAMEARGGREVQLYSYFELGTRKGVCGFVTKKMTRYPSYRRRMGLRAGQAGCGKNRPHQDLIPGTSSP